MFIWVVSVGVIAPDNGNPLYALFLWLEPRIANATVSITMTLSKISWILPMTHCLLLNDQPHHKGHT